MTIRTRLPMRRPHDSFRCQIEGIEYAIGIGRAGEGGPVAEIWLDASKVGSSIAALANDAAIMGSLLLQHGCPIETIRHALTRNNDGAFASAIGKVFDEIVKMEAGA